jgi:hypothetical protein
MNSFSRISSLSISPSLSLSGTCTTKEPALTTCYLSCLFTPPCTGSPPHTLNSFSTHAPTSLNTSTHTHSHFTHTVLRAHLKKVCSMTFSLKLQILIFPEKAMTNSKSYPSIPSWTFFKLSGIQIFLKLQFKSFDGLEFFCFNLINTILFIDFPMNKISIF